MLVQDKFKMKRGLLVENKVGVIILMILIALLLWFAMRRVINNAF